MTDAASLPRPITIAHRYGNSISRLREAADAGADFVECDVWLRQGRLEVRHEHTLGPLPILYDKWKLERLHAVPSLADVLDALPPGMGVMIDLKGTNPGMPAAVIEAVTSHLDAHPIMVSARTWPWLPMLLEAHPGIMAFHSVGKRAFLERVRPLLEAADNDAISIHYGLLSAEIVRLLHESVALIATWPINDERRLAEALSWHVDAIITDELDLVRRMARDR